MSSCQIMCSVGLAEKGCVLLQSSKSFINLASEILLAGFGH